jgi:hypothetical protein
MDMAHRKDILDEIKYHFCNINEGFSFLNYNYFPVQQ